MELEDMLGAERQAIAARRRRRADEEWFAHDDNLLGVALSGGGIRSATLSLGFLEILNRFGVLSQADYLSTVSGGGYLGGYVHAKLATNEQRSDPFAQLFTPRDIDHLRRHGNYLAPGKGVRKWQTRLRMAGALVAGLALNAIVLGTLVWGLYLLAAAGWRSPAHTILPSMGLVVVAGLLAWHLFLHPLRHRGWWSSVVLNMIEGVVLLAVPVLAALWWLCGLVFGPHWSALGDAVLALVAGAVAGFFANPNLLSLHRFYRDRLARAYLDVCAVAGGAVRLRELARGDAPYPLINTCLNLAGEDDDRFKGARTSDYFLLSPLHCGSKLTGYVATDTPRYREMTLATAVACSGAAVNPGMGPRTNRLLAILLSVLNLRLGYWVPNPRLAGTARRFRWWPYYQLLDLCGRSDSRRRLVDISDGGFSDNLGVIELLRRQCRLIIALDTTADPDYAFSDLKNLVVRARQELGVTIRFRQDPEAWIRVQPSNGFARSHFVVADVADLPGKVGTPYSALLVYVKASLRAQRRWRQLDSRSFAYKTYHARFPHETTADQFFDEAQWQAYYRLGQFIAGDLLQQDVRDEVGGGRVLADRLYQIFHSLTDGEQLQDYLGLT